MLKERLGTKQFKFINQGIAGYESYNVLKKLDKAVKTEPDYVVILAGTNDVLSSLDPKLARLSRKLKKIPHEPTLSHFSHNIKRIVQKLKEDTPSKIAICSLPVVGENLDSLENTTLADYNAELKQIAGKEEVAYLPVNEKQRDFLNREISGKGKGYNRNKNIAFRSLLQHFLKFMSLDAISEKNGYLLLTDGIHQNSLGAKMIADEIEKFIKVYHTP